nr:hypothetical protein [Candidatus Anoxychlamydiales bacterium]
MPIHVHTLGDSTLDNLYWRLGETPSLTDAKSTSVEGRLKSILGRGFEVISHAFDGFTTRSILNGSNIGTVLPRDRIAFPSYIAEKAPKERFIKPLEALQKEVSKDSNAYHYVVLSVAGNDFRENLLNPIRFVKDISSIQKRYLQIVEKIKSLKGRNIRPLLMLQYRTDAKNDLYRIYTVLKIIGVAALVMQIGCFALLTAPIWVTIGKISALVGGLVFAGGALGLYLNKRLLPLLALKDILIGKKISMLFMDTLLQSFYRPILQQAKKDKIPILDLSNTFNPYKDLYDHGIEPGKQGAELIAEGIAH